MSKEKMHLFPGKIPAQKSGAATQQDGGAVPPLGESEPRTLQVAPPDNLARQVNKTPTVDGSEKNNKPLGMGYRIALLFFGWSGLLLTMGALPPQQLDNMAFVLGAVIAFAYFAWELFLPKKLGYFLLSFGVSCVVAWYTDDLIVANHKPAAAVSQTQK